LVEQEGDITIAESDEIGEVKGADHGEMAWVGLLEDAALLVDCCEAVNGCCGVRLWLTRTWLRDDLLSFLL